jgi:(1->4)-alpha-D-glucan 1-alpha-D-glucosylmutase
VNSLAQTLLKITAPGIPDLYQGTELWDLALVDPDNRRPVDFAGRRARLDELRGRLPADESAGADLTGLCAELIEHWPDGRIKLYVLHRALTLRRRRSRLLGAGEYRALVPSGPHADHVVAFARVAGPDAVPDAVIVAGPRLTARLAGLTGRFPLGEAAWEQTWVTVGDERLAGVYRDRFTGRRIATESRDGAAALPAASLFGHFPVALLEREGGAR